MAAANLTAEASAGYFGNDNPHLWSSPCWYAHALGRYLHATGRTVPRDVRMSRGNSIRCGDMLFSFTHTAPGRITFTRER
jgi:hypothetical protein